MVELSEKWLLGTVPGVLVLSVVGAFAAALIFWIFKHVLGPLLVWLLKLMFVKGPDFLTHGVLLDHALLRETTHPDRVIRFYAYQVGKLILGLALLGSLSLGSVVGTLLVGPGLIRAILYIALALFFVRMVTRAYMTLSITQHFNEADLERLMDKAKMSGARKFDMSLKEHKKQPE